MDKRGDDACILLMNVLKEVEKYRDKRLVENFVVTSVMEYVRIYGMENTEGMDRIFRKRVHRAGYGLLRHGAAAPAGTAATLAGFLAVLGAGDLLALTVLGR